MGQHAKYSPSKAEQWFGCPGGIAYASQFQDKSSADADWGTAAHELAAECLAIPASVARASLGHEMTNGVIVDEEMVEAVQYCVDRVRELAGDAPLFIEQQVDFSLYAGVPEQGGTLDVAWIADNELCVWDHKFGRGVAVSAEGNKQLQVYALGALLKHDPLGDIERARLFICQPRNGGVSEWALPVEDLFAFGEEVRAAVARAEAPDAPRIPGAKSCRWCKGKATCPELAAHIEAETGAMFEDLTAPAAPTEADDLLHKKMALVDLVEGWCKAVRAECERRLLAGTPVPGWKLVQGRQGARKWSSEAEAEAALKAMRIPHEQMYDYKVVSPTTAEKLAKDKVIGPRQWPKLQPLISRSPGSPSVAPESDKREALVITPVVDQFEDVSEVTAATADLI